MIKAKKKVMFCFYKGDISNDINILENLDSKGFEVHLFNNIDKDNLKHDILLDIIKELYENKEYQCDIYVSSNVKEFIMVQYILYKEWIAAVLYLNSNPVHFQLEELYQLILNANLNKSSSSFYTLKKEDSIFSNYNIFNGYFQTDACDKCSENVAYNFKGINHIFSISNEESVNIISLDNSNNKGVFNYHFNLDYLDEFLQLVSHNSESIKEFIKSYSFICSKLSELKNKISSLLDFEKKIVKFKLENELYKNGNKDNYKIFLSSILLDIFNEEKYLEYLIDVLIKSKTIDKYGEFFIYYQYVRYIFVNKSIATESTLKIIENLYYNIFEEFSYLAKSYRFIPKEMRDEKLVFVFTSQFVGINHAPSKLALDVCYSLMKELNKNVILINTREVLTHKGLIPMANIFSGSVVDNLSNINTITYKDKNIPFYQPEVAMPDDSKVTNILNMISVHKPDLIMNIGTCLTGDLCTCIVPTVTLPTESDGYSKSTFYVVNGKEGFIEYNKRHSRNPKSLIISKFAFELKSKQHTFTKEELGIPKNKFIIAIIGNRLNEEIDEDFLQLLEKSCELNNTYILFIGKFNFSYQQIVKYKNLINNYKNIGYQEDLLAVMENIDLYVNPNRNGGGTSAIYAMYSGKPVVTLNYGDVANNVGKEFQVRTYDEMFNKIYKYCSDREFYNKQSAIGKERALRITDMSRYVNDVYEKVTEAFI